MKSHHYSIPTRQQEVFQAIQISKQELRLIALAQAETILTKLL